jgi:uncharacterized membrane protein YphA (DoxX/SURF4 family)
MSGKTIAYWITTVVVAGFMAFNAYLYLSHDPKMMASFASLGYPSYFPLILGTAKILGAVALLVPGLARLKEWAYAGFTFTFIGAVFSHLESGQQKEALMPFTVLVILAVSYLLRPPGRRLVEAPPHNP